MSFLSGGFYILLLALGVVYFLLPKGRRYLALLAGSLIFYGLVDVRFLPFLLLTATAAFFAARRMGDSLQRQKAFVAENRARLPKPALEAYRQGQNRRRQGVFVLCLLFNLGLLGALKYLPWAMDTLSAPWQIHWVLPLGISFYTFQSLGYLMDVKRGKYPPEENYLRFLLFVSFFPQLVQGPISRYDMLSTTLYAGADFDLNRLGRGLVRMAWGAMKKLLVADRLFPLLTLIFDTEGYLVVPGMVLYALRLYADFTGGIDMALGVGEIFGVTLPENFDRPYFSRSIEEYWTRWHISMGSWFRDYVFYPLNMSRPFLRWTKKLRTRFCGGQMSRLPLYVSTLIVWLLTGIWHGAGWNFALWGLCNGAVMVLSLVCRPCFEGFHKKHPTLKGTKAYAAFEILRTFGLMCLLRLWDCYTTPRLVGRALLSLLQPWDVAALAAALVPGEWAVLALMTGAMVFVSIQKGGGFRTRYLTTTSKLYLAAALLLVLTLLFGAYGQGYAAADFIYGRF